MSIAWRSVRGQRRRAAFTIVLSLTAGLGVVSAGCQSKTPDTTSDAYRQSFKADPTRMPKEFMNHPTGPPVTVPSSVPENVRAQVQTQASQAMQAVHAAQAAQATH